MKNKVINFIAYHGSVEDNLVLDDNRAFYLTDNYNIAKDFAYREVYGDGLYEDEIPIIYKFKGTFKNPYYLTDEDYDNEGQDSNIDYDKWIKKGVDGLIYKGHGSTYYIAINKNSIKLLGKKYLPYDEDMLIRTDDENDYDDIIVKESVQYDDLTFNLASNKFEQLTVIKNPSIDWIKNKIQQSDLRFIYNPNISTLYIWNGSRWMHSEVMDNANLKLSDNDIIGILSPNLVEVWSEISPNEDEEEAKELTKKYFGHILKDIFPNGYRIVTYS